MAQSLAAHGGDRLAATLVGRRVPYRGTPPLQREVSVAKLIACACEQAAQCDYLPSSFGYVAGAVAFLWQRCGFVLVRDGQPSGRREQRLLYGDGAIAAERRGKTAGAAGTLTFALRCGYPDAVERRGDTAGGVR